MWTPAARPRHGADKVRVALTPPPGHVRLELEELEAPAPPLLLLCELELLELCELLLLLVLLLLLLTLLELLLLVLLELLGQV